MNMIEMVINGLQIQNSDAVRYEASYVSQGATSNNKNNTSQGQFILQKYGNITDQYSIRFSKLQAYTSYRIIVSPILLINNDYGHQMQLKKIPCATKHIRTSPGSMNKHI